MTTKLLEFNNKENQILRGILVTAENKNNDYIVIMLGGFERAGTTERKFKSLADELAEDNITSFRFDATDCGLSDGDFYNMTTASLAEDLLSSLNYLKNQGFQKLALVGHSLAGCAIALILDKIVTEKIVLLAPALNQKDLLRYWFVAKAEKDIEINWSNYKQYLKEKDFLTSLKSDLIAKAHKLGPAYRQKNKDLDYTEKFLNYPPEKILLVHGTEDEQVPLESLSSTFKNKIIVTGGNHNLESPGMIEQWLDKTANFLK